MNYFETKHPIYTGQSTPPMTREMMERLWALRFEGDLKEGHSLRKVEEMPDLWQYRLIHNAPGEEW